MRAAAERAGNRRPSVRRIVIPHFSEFGRRDAADVDPASGGNAGPPAPTVERSRRAGVRLSRACRADARVRAPA
ncbi:hypothetical protein ACX84U_34260, partial [Burkholderia pseudomallei]